MKRILSLLVITVTFIALVACSTTTTETTTSETTTNLTTHESTTQAPTTVAPTTATPTTQATTTEILGYQINNLVVVDNADIKITLKEAYDDDFWGFTIEVLVENKTPDQKIMISLNNVVINGYDSSTFWVDVIEAGKASNSEIHLYDTTLEELGMSTFDKIELYFRAIDYDDWMADPILNESYTIYPTGLTEQEIVFPNRPTSENELIVVDNEYFTFVIIDTYTDPIWGYTLTCYIENKTTDIELMFSWDDVSVNNFMIDPYWAKILLPKTKAITSISFYSEDFENNGITVVNEIEFNLSVYDFTDFFSDYLLDATFTYNPVE